VVRAQVRLEARPIILGRRPRRLAFIPIVSPPCRHLAISSPSDVACGEAPGRPADPNFRRTRNDPGVRVGLGKLADASAKSLIPRESTTTSGRPTPASAAASLLPKPRWFKHDRRNVECRRRSTRFS